VHIIESSRTPILWTVSAWLFFAIAMPTRVANFDFRHFSDEEGLTITFSRSAPPLAALEDEKLQAVLTEPIQELKPGKNEKIIAAGTMAAWPRLQRYSRLFEHKQQRLMATKKYAFHAGRKPFSGQQLGSVSELVKLVTPV
jgi:hypothetical protein